METIIKINKDDILTSRIGNNIKVQVDEKLSIVFTPDALDELFSDYAVIKPEIDSENDSVKYIKFGEPTMEELGQLKIDFPQDDAEEAIKQALREEIKNVEF
jgi:hypothetical protein